MRGVLAEDLLVLDADSPLWNAARPLLEAALRLEQRDGTYSWHGWRKKDIEAFLKTLPAHCTLLAGVWDVSEDTEVPDAQLVQERETLVLGCACEVIEGEICSIRTFSALADANLPPVEQLEPGYPDALELMRVAKARIAPVAWAIFTDRTAWQEWIFGDGDNESVADKGELLASLARQGRCVLLGSQVTHNHS
jgi:hypothetical protein